MNARRKIAGGAAVVAGGHGAGLVASLVRNIIIARAIGVENFGIASTFLVTLSLLELLADLSIDKLLVQAADGDDPRLQGAAHAINAARGVLIAVLLAALASPIARLFESPEATWAYMVLAVVPLIRGLAHLDPRRVQRRLSFLPLTVVDTGSQLFAVLLATVAVLWIRDYSVALWVLIGQAVAYAVATHILAERAYAWSFDRDAWARFARFGWPLMLNGLCLWISTQSDRVIVGAMLSMAALGVYTALVSLLHAPTALIMNVVGRVGLPVLSQARTNPEQFRTIVLRTTLGYSALVIVVYIAAAVLLRPLLVLFGQNFDISPVTAVAITVVFAMRCVRGVPILISLATAQTKLLLLANVVRAIVFPIAGLLAGTVGTVMAVVMALGLAEAAALLVSWAIVRLEGLPNRTRWLLFSVSVSAPITVALVGTGYVLL